LKIRLGILVSLLLLITFPYEGHSKAGPDEVITRLKSTYSDIKDLTADFTQKSIIIGFGEKVYKGRMYLKKPKMVRWDYSNPAKQNIFIKDEKVILYMPEEKQAIVQNLTNHPDAEPAMGLLSNIETWEEQFTVTGGDVIGNVINLTLLPKSMLLFDKALVEVDKETFYISKLTLFEKSGNMVSFNFSGIKTNSSLRDKLFDFRIPKGVEVLEY